MSLPPFHLAFPVTDLDATLHFYRDILGCAVGRRATRWIDFDLFGHQITAHLREAGSDESHNPVDGKSIPVPHFGAVLPWEQFHAFADRLAHFDVPFIHEPQVRFAGQVGEQATLFVRDPNGNALEFKSFKDPAQMFAVDGPPEPPA